MPTPESLSLDRARRWPASATRVIDDGRDRPAPDRYEGSALVVVSIEARACEGGVDRTEPITEPDIRKLGASAFAAGAIGSGSHMPKLHSVTESSAATPQLGPRTHLVGEWPLADLQPLIDASQGLIFTSDRPRFHPPEGSQPSPWPRHLVIEVETEDCGGPCPTPGYYIVSGIRPDLASRLLPGRGGSETA